MIFKIVIPRSIFNKDKEDIKLIFIGNISKLKIDNPDRFYNLLNKIESQGFDNLSSNDITFLNNSIPSIKSKIGNTSNYQLKFIYQSIPDTIINRNLNVFILDLLLQFNSKFGDMFPVNFTSFKKYGILGYYYNISTDKTLVADVINYIFHCEGVNKLLTIKKFILGLKNNIYLTLPEKTIKDNMVYFELGTDENSELAPIEYLSSAKIRQFITDNIPNVLGYYKSKSILSFLEEDNIKKEDIVKNYENFGCYFYNYDTDTMTDTRSQIIKRMLNSVFTYDSGFTKKYELNLDLVININDIYNNTLYLYLGEDIHDCDELDMNIKRVFNEMCFKIKDTSSIINIITESQFWQSAFINRNSFVINNNYINVNRNIEKTNKTMDFMITINNQYWNKLTFAGYLNQPGLALNLMELFKNSKVSFYCPVVKFINNQEVKNYNVYLPFIKTLDSNLVRLYFNNNDILNQLNDNIFSNHINMELRRLKYNKLLSYLLYKVILDQENPSLFLNIFVFESGYIIFNINNANNLALEYQILEKAFTFLDVILKKIKTLFNLKKLALLNPEKSVLLSSYLKNPKLYKSIFIIEQITSIELNLNFKSYYVFQNFVKKIIDNKIFGPEYNKQLLDIKSEEYQKSFYIFITRNKLKDNKNILPLLNNIISRNPNYKKTFLTDNEIRYIYTQIDGFAHKSNIIQYMFSKISTLGGALTKAKEKDLILETAYLFNKTVEEINNIFSTLLKLDIQGTNKFHYLCTFVIKTDIENKCFNIVFQGSYNIDIINSVINYINFSFNQLFTEIINEPYDSLFINTDITKSILDMDNIFKKQLNNVNIKSELDSIIESNKVIKSYFEYDKLQSLSHSKPGLKSIKQRTPNSLSSHIVSLDNIDTDIDSLYLDLDIDMNYDYDIDIDFDALDALDKLDNNDAIKNTIHNNNKQSPKNITELAKVDIGELDMKDIVGKTKKLSEAEYIKLMRRKFDPDLYEPATDSADDRFKADDSCPKTERRIPYIVTKEQLKTFNPKAFNGYLKYRENYYICPRLWDAKAEKPISVEDFIKSGLKSPYSDGELITSGPSGKYITDKYNVILRKPTTNKKWSDPGLHKDWPDILRHTEKEAYPGLTKGNKHPQKMCLPCCFSNKPDNYDVNKLEIQEIKKPRGYNACKQFINIVKTGDTKLPDMELLKYDNYVSNELTVLKYGRLGLLPHDIDILLNNMQDIFLSDNGNNLLEYSNVFLRLGLTNNKEYNILESIAVCLSIPLQSFINVIIDKLQPTDFIVLNNGSLVDEFYVGNNLYLPYDSNDYNKFIKFCNYYNDLFIYLSISYENFMLDLEKFKSNIINKDYSVSSYGDNFETELKLLYKIFVAYYNYLKFIGSQTETKQIHHVIDIFTAPRKWMFKEGVNILIFNKDHKSIKCGYTTNLKTSKLILLLEEDKNIYIPIIQVKVFALNKLVRYPIIELNNSVNLNEKAIAFFQAKKPQYVKMMLLLEDKLEQLVKLLYIKNQVCRFDLKLVNDNIFTYLKRNKITIESQFTNFSGISGSISYIRLLFYKNDKHMNNTNNSDLDIDLEIDNKLVNQDKANAKVQLTNLDDKPLSIVLPIYSNHILKDITVHDFNTLNKFIDSDNITFSYIVNVIYEIEYNIVKSISSDTMNMLHIKLDTLKNYGYNIESVNVERVGDVFMITGIIFTNGLLMILKPELFEKDKYTKLYDKLNASYKIRLTITNKILINYCKYGLLANKVGDMNNRLMLKGHDMELLNLYEYGLDVLEKYIMIKLSEAISANKKKYIDIYNFFTIDITDEYSETEDIKTARISKSTVLLRVEVIKIYKLFKKLVGDSLSVELVKDMDDDSLLKVIDNLNDKVEYRLINYKNEFTSILNAIMNNKYKSISKLKLLDVSFESMILNIITKLFLDARLRHDFMNNKLIGFNVYTTVYFEDIINKETYNPLKKYIVDNNLGLICNSDELNYIIKNYLLSKYKNEYYILDDTIDNIDFNIKKLGIPSHIKDIIKTKITANISKDNIRLKTILNLNNIHSLIKSTDKSSQSSSSVNKKIIISTLFNSKGLYNPHAQVGECKFPYRNIRGKLSYNCNPADKLFSRTYLSNKYLKPTDLICPTSVNKQLQPEKFGYCPEKQIVTNERFHVKSRYTQTKNNECIFPYIFFNKKIINPLSGSTPLLKVNFNCFKKRKEEGSWCFVNNSKKRYDVEVSDSNFNTTFLIGATKNDDIYYGLWSMDKILEDTNKNVKYLDKKKLNDMFELLNYREEKCIEPDNTLLEQKKIEKYLQLTNVKAITLDEYDHSFCMLSESKKGYSKKQLYIFGRDVLNIPYTMLINKHKRIKSKIELCKLFEAKITDLKKLDVLKKLKVDESELDLTTIYTKDPEQCTQGEGKGGYKLLELRNIATTFLGLKFDKAFSMNKEQLCNYIIPKIFDSSLQSKNTNTVNNKVVSKDPIYPPNKDMYLCEKPINRGGIDIKTVRAIATKLNINYKDRLKEDVCKDIRDTLENIQDDTAQTTQQLDVDDKLKLNDITNTLTPSTTSSEFNI